GRGRRTPTGCCRARSSGCACPGAAARRSPPSPERSPRSRRLTRSSRITSPRPSPTEHRVSWLRKNELPPLLRAIHDPPDRLYLRRAGDPGLLARPAVAIVGARACSPYGAQVARMLGRELANAGVVVVSGLARGVDGEAHRGALETSGHTVAVLGCGIDRDYPAAHAWLARAIAEHSLIVSEYEPGVPPAPYRFPARNRIVSGPCAATVVVEA